MRRPGAAVGHVVPLLRRNGRKRHGDRAERPQLGHAATRALAAKTDPAAWIGMTTIYGDLAQNATFAKGFAEALTFVWANGAEAAMRRYIG